MDRLKHPHRISDIAAVGKPHAADDTGTDITQNIAIGIFGKNDIESFRVHHNLHGTGIDGHVIGFYIRIGFGNFIKHLPHGLIGIGKYMGFMRKGYFFAAFFQSELKTESDNPLHSSFGKNSKVNVIVSINIAVTAVQTFGIFPDDNQIRLFLNRFGSRQGFNRTDIGVQIKTQSKSHQHFHRMGIAGSSEQHGIGLCNPIEGLLWKGVAVFFNRRFTGDSSLSIFAIINSLFKVENPQLWEWARACDMSGRVFNTWCSSFITRVESDIRTRRFTVYLRAYLNELWLLNSHYYEYVEQFYEVAGKVEIPQETAGQYNRFVTEYNAFVQDFRGQIGELKKVARTEIEPPSVKLAKELLEAKPARKEEEPPKPTEHKGYIM